MKRQHFIVIARIGIAALYLTLLLYKFSAFETMGQGCLICFYWFLLLYGMARFFEKRSGGDIKDVRVMYAAAFVISALSLAFCLDFFLLHFRQNSRIEVIATGEKNKEAQSDEVRIGEIKTDDIAVDLGAVSLADGWYYLSDSEMLVSYPNGKESVQPIDFGTAENISITFVKHPWSGNVAIRSKEHSYTIDLYDPEGSVFVFETKGYLYQKQWLDLISAVIAWAILFYVYFGILLLSAKNKKYLIAMQTLFTAIVFGNMEEAIEISSRTLLWIIIGYSFIGTAGFLWYSGHGAKAMKIALFFAAALVAYFWIGRKMLKGAEDSLLLSVKLLGVAIWLLPCLAFMEKLLEDMASKLSKRK